MGAMISKFLRDPIKPPADQKTTGRPAYIIYSGISSAWVTCFNCPSFRLLTNYKRILTQSNFITPQVPYILKNVRFLVITIGPRIQKIEGEKQLSRRWKVLQFLLSLSVGLSVCLCVCVSSRLEATVFDIGSWFLAWATLWWIPPGFVFKFLNFLCDCCMGEKDLGLVLFVCRFLYIGVARIQITVFGLQ